MNTSTQGKNLIKQAEGCRLTAYKCAAGVWTIGYGHTQGVRAGQSITQQQAEEMLAADLATYERAVGKVSQKLTQEQFDACVSLCYNIGTGAFVSSTAAALIAADPTPRPELERAWKSWNKAGGKTLDGLVKRRAKEWQLYSKASSTLSATIFGIAAAAVAVAGSLILIS